MVMINKVVVALSLLFSAPFVGAEKADPEEVLNAAKDLTKLASMYTEGKTEPNGKLEPCPFTKKDGVCKMGTAKCLCSMASTPDFTMDHVVMQKTGTPEQSGDVTQKVDEVPENLSEKEDSTAVDNANSDESHQAIQGDINEASQETADKTGATDNLKLRVEDGQVKVVIPEVVLPLKSVDDTTPGDSDTISKKEEESPKEESSTGQDEGSQSSPMEATPNEASAVPEEETKAEETKDEAKIEAPVEKPIIVPTSSDATSNSKPVEEHKEESSTQWLDDMEPELNVSRNEKGDLLAGKENRRLGVVKAGTKDKMPGNLKDKLKSSKKYKHVHEYEYLRIRDIDTALPGKSIKKNTKLSVPKEPLVHVKEEKEVVDDLPVDDTISANLVEGTKEGASSGQDEVPSSPSQGGLSVTEVPEEDVKDSNEPNLGEEEEVKIEEPAVESEELKEDEVEVEDPNIEEKVQDVPVEDPTVASDPSDTISSPSVEETKEEKDGDEDDTEDKLTLPFQSVDEAAENEPEPHNDGGSSPKESLSNSIAEVPEGDVSEEENEPNLEEEEEVKEEPTEEEVKEEPTEEEVKEEPAEEEVKEEPAEEEVKEEPAVEKVKVEPTVEKVKVEPTVEKVKVEPTVEKVPAVEPTVGSTSSDKAPNTMPVGDKKETVTSPTQLTGPPAENIVSKILATNGNGATVPTPKPVEGAKNEVGNNLIQATQPVVHQTQYTVVPPVNDLKAPVPSPTTVTQTPAVAAQPATGDHLKELLGAFPPSTLNMEDNKHSFLQVASTDNGEVEKGGSLRGLRRRNRRRKHSHNAKKRRRAMAKKQRKLERRRKKLEKRKKKLEEKRRKKEEEEKRRIEEERKIDEEEKKINEEENNKLEEENTNLEQEGDNVTHHPDQPEEDETDTEDSVTAEEKKAEKKRKKAEKKRRKAEKKRRKAEKKRRKAEKKRRKAALKKKKLEKMGDAHVSHLEGDRTVVHQQTPMIDAGILTNENEKPVNVEHKSDHTM